jgi:hypothetical protein
VKLLEGDKHSEKTRTLENSQHGKPFG